MNPSNYDKFPQIAVPGMAGDCWSGWRDVVAALSDRLAEKQGARIVTIECYVGVASDEIVAAIRKHLPAAAVFQAGDAFRESDEIERRVAPFIGKDDPLFGYVSGLRLEDYFCPAKLETLRGDIDRRTHPAIFVVGPGASVVHRGDLLVYAEMPRWEAQNRMRRNELSNLGADNRALKASLKHKRAYFNDWPVCDRLKLELDGVDFILDTCKPGEPKMISARAATTAYETALTRPFRVVPFFEPAPWGGQWMKKTMALPEETPNYGWCFDCVPEENSLLFRFGETIVELPAMNVVYFDPDRLLGEKIHARFGLSFPIRFNLLDTVGGGNLSFQVHPFLDYAQRNFGVHYTQEESYYLLAAEEKSFIYLGLKENVVPEEMIGALEAAQSGGPPFDDEKFACKWPAKRHDHFLIPPGTCHCSGAGTVVLEISATPNVFTFKLWDWGRTGLDGLPRPINIDRGKRNIAWERTEDWVGRELINAVHEVASGDGWREEQTGLHEQEFIETRRHWFTAPVAHDTGGGVNVLHLAEGREIVVESPDDAFPPFVVHYAETFVVPASVGSYTIRPHGEAEGTTCATIKAYVRV